MACHHRGRIHEMRVKDASQPGGVHTSPSVLSIHAVVRNEVEVLQGSRECF